MSKKEKAVIIIIFGSGIISTADYFPAEICGFDTTLVIGLISTSVIIIGFVLLVKSLNEDLKN